MIPEAMFGLGVPELLIILAVVLLLFGGSRLAGLGKSTGRALKEFKEETKGLKSEDTENDQITGTTTQPPAARPAPQAPIQDPAPNDVRKDL
jgi:sec-independent protein translocase protein TatA